MQYTLKEPIHYHTLSGFDIAYDCIEIKKTKKGTQLIMTRTTGLPTRLEIVLTADHITQHQDLIALKQNSKCVEISNELIRRGILSIKRKETIKSGFVTYNLYQFNPSFFKTNTSENEIVERYGKKTFTKKELDKLNKEYVGVFAGETTQ